MVGVFFVYVCEVVVPFPLNSFSPVGGVEGRRKEEKSEVERMGKMKVCEGERSEKGILQVINDKIRAQ